MLMALLHGPLAAGTDALTSAGGTVFAYTQPKLGFVIAVIGGCRAAFQASRGRDFTGELIGAIAGCCIVALAAFGSLGLSAGTSAAVTEAMNARGVVGGSVGAIVTVIGGILTAMKLVNGQKATSQLVCTITGVCIAAVSLSV